MSVVIGIDLGTTSSSVAIYKKGRVEILPNANNSRSLASYVSFIDDNFMVGEEAKSRIESEPFSVVYDAKRMIALEFDDERMQERVCTWPFEVSCVNGFTTLIFRNGDEQMQLRPKEALALVLTKLKDVAEDKLGLIVSKAVISVPACYNQKQRKEIKDAALIAKLEVIALLDEPTAAAIAFSFELKDNSKKNVFVYDIGGGTFDVSVICIDKGNINVRAVNGDAHFGGRDFDTKIVDYFVAEIKTKYGVNLMLTKYRKSLAKLRVKCEDLKIHLSTPKREKAQIAIDALFDGIDFKSVMTVAKFNEICDHMMRSTLNPVNKALRDANMKVTDFEEILLIGGSTRIPKIQQLVETFFGKAVNKCINSEEAVVCGTAIHAWFLETERVNEYGQHLIRTNFKQASEYQLREEAKKELMKCIQQWQQSSPLSELKHLESYKKYNQTLHAQIEEAKELLANDELHFGSLMSAKLNLLTFINESREALEKDEMCRLEAKLAVSNLLRKFTQLLSGETKKLLFLQYIVDKINKCVSESHQWLFEHNYAFEKDYIEYGEKLKQKYNSLVEDIKKEQPRIVKGKVHCCDNCIDFNLSDTRILIYVMTQSGKKHAVNVERDSSILNLKAIIEIKEGIACDNQRLIFAGQQLLDDRTLSHYNVRSGSVIHMILRLSGC